MALIICPECGKEISDTARSCPNCGYVMKKEETAEPIAVVSEENTPQPPVKKYLLKTFLLWLLPIVEAALVGFLAGLSGIDMINMSVLYGLLAINAILSGILLIKIVRAILAGKKRKSKVYRNVIAMVLCACFLVLNGGLALEGSPDASYTSEAISVCKDLRSRLKSPDSLQIHSITAKINQERQVTYLLIDYSAQNGFGGMNRQIATYKNGVCIGLKERTSEERAISASMNTKTKEMTAAGIAEIERNLK